MSAKKNRTAPGHRLAHWFQMSGIARFSETTEFRAKGSVELSQACRKDLHGTFCAMETIRIVNTFGSGPFRHKLSCGWQDGQLNTCPTLILPANAEIDVHTAHEHRTLSLSIDPTMLEAQIHLPAERLVVAFERLSDQICAKDSISNLIREIWHNSANETGWLGELFCDSASLALVAYLLREELRFDPQVKRGGLPPHQMRLLIEFMSSRLSDKLRISELASITGLSEYHFIRAFRRETGVTPYQYVLRMRINRASELLRQRPYKCIDEIALLCGFCSGSNLSLQFRRMTGMSPRLYRRRL